MNDEIEPNTSSKPENGSWATGGAVAAAVLASSCCILPLVFGAAGISTIALAGAFESARPLMLGVTAVLLAIGFYSNYFRKPDCATGESCEKPRPGLRRFSRSMLWLATVAVVALAFFPFYATVFAADQTPAATDLERVASTEMVLEVSGMTCEACSVSVQNELAAVPGVLRSEVDFDSGKAIILVRRGAPPTASDLLSAVNRAGYSAVVALAGSGGEG